MSKTTEKYTNLSYNVKGTITFAVKDAYSYFGITYSEEYKNYSIGLNNGDKLFDNLKAVEEKAKTFVTDRTLSKPLLRALVEKDGYKNLYLKLKKDEFDEDMLDVKNVMVNAQITVTAIYKGCEYPSLLEYVDRISVAKAPPRPKPVREVISDDDDDDPYGVDGYICTIGDDDGYICVSCSDYGKDGDDDGKIGYICTSCSNSGYGNDDDGPFTSDFCGMNGYTCTSCSNSGKDYSLSQW